MLPTYPAILRDGSPDWGAGGAPPLPAGNVPVHVTLLVPPSLAARGPAMAALAAAGGPSGFGDPPSGRGRFGTSFPCPADRGEARQQLGHRRRTPRVLRPPPQFGQEAFHVDRVVPEPRGTD